jgi:hypothetical protein
MSFRDGIDIDLSTYATLHNEIDACLALGLPEGITGLPQCETQVTDLHPLAASVRRTYPISPKRQGVIDFIVSQQYELMLTVASPLILPEQDYIDNVWFLCKKVNGHYFGRSSTKHRRKGLTGHVAAEPHTFSTYLRGTLHFHILLRFQPEFADIDEFRAAVLEYVPHVKDREKNLALDVSMVDVRPILDLPNYNLPRLAQYVTKSMEHPIFANGEYQMPLRPEGIDGIALRSRKEMTNY